MSPKQFNYEITDLIKLVECRPALWDKTNAQYKCKKYKDNGWKEVCRHLDSDYDSMEVDEQTRLESTITDKWRNIRDAFSKSIRRRGDFTGNRRYIYSSNLQFLLKSMVFNIGSSIERNANKKLAIAELQGSSPQLGTSNSSAKRQKRPASPERDPLASKAETSQHETHQRDQLDEDEAFFVSVLPLVRSMQLDEKLEFRMEVLKIVQNIRSRYQSHSFTPTSTSPVCLKSSISDYEDSENSNI